MSVYNIILKQITIYAGTSLFVSGVLGNLINICVFFKNNLENPSTFLLFLGSCSNIIYMYVGLLMRLLAVAFYTDLTALSISWCKMRFYLMQICILTSLFCICYAVVDQFFLSSNQEKWRRLSRISLTRKITLLSIVASILYSIPLIIFSDIIYKSNETFICTIFTYDLNFARFASYFTLPIIWAITPICVLIIFGVLTYRNISLLRGNLNRERTQRQLTSMILLHVIFIIVGTTPFAFFYIYLAITLSDIKSLERQALENLLENIVSLISYVPFSCSFFVYYFSSKTHRNHVKQLLHIHRRRNQVATRVNNPT